MYDAAVAQAIYYYSNEQLGGFPGTVEKMMEADPDFAMGHIFKLGLENFGNIVLRNYKYLCLRHFVWG